MIIGLACILGFIAIAIFMTGQRARTKPKGFLKYFGRIALCCGFASFALWAHGVGWERAIAIWAIQIMTCGTLFSIWFAWRDALHVPAIDRKS